MESTIIHWGYIMKMEKKMETTIQEKITPNSPSGFDNLALLFFWSGAS